MGDLVRGGGRWEMGRDLSFGAEGARRHPYRLKNSRETHLRGYTLAILSPYQVGHHPVAPAAASNPLLPPPSVSSRIIHIHIQYHTHIHHTPYTVQGKAVTAKDLLSRSMSVTVDSKDAKLIGGGYRGALTRVGLHQARRMGECIMCGAVCYMVLYGDGW